MTITAGFCDSFKKELLNMEHTAGATYKIALYTSSATLSAATTAYTATNEVTSTGTNYTTKGQTLSGFTATLIGTTGCLEWTADPAWATSTITARGAMIFNESITGDTALCILDFAGDIASTNGTFTVTFPTYGSTTALMRIA
jgi:hypothetical protein